MSILFVYNPTHLSSEDDKIHTSPTSATRAIQLDQAAGIELCKSGPKWPDMWGIRFFGFGLDGLHFKGFGAEARAAFVFDTLLECLSKPPASKVIRMSDILNSYFMLHPEQVNSWP